jgi:hypothetical protein
LIDFRVPRLLPFMAGLFEGFLLPSSLGLKTPHPLFYMSFLLLLLIILLFFFSWVGVSLSRGLCWSGPGLSEGTMYHLAHLPKPSGQGHLAAQGVSWFLCLTWSGDAMHRLQVWRSQSFASSGLFFL